LQDIIKTHSAELNRIVIINSDSKALMNLVRILRQSVLSQIEDISIYFKENLLIITSELSITQVFSILIKKLFGRHHGMEEVLSGRRF